MHLSTPRSRAYVHHTRREQPFHVSSFIRRLCECACTSACQQFRVLSGARLLANGFWFALLGLVYTAGDTRQQQRVYTFETTTMCVRDTHSNDVHFISQKYEYRGRAEQSQKPLPVFVRGAASGEQTKPFYIHHASMYTVIALCVCVCERVYAAIVYQTNPSTSSACVTCTRQYTATCTYTHTRQSFWRMALSTRCSLSSQSSGLKCVFYAHASSRRPFAADTYMRYVLRFTQPLRVSACTASEGCAPHHAQCNRGNRTSGAAEQSSAA